MIGADQVQRFRAAVLQRLGLYFEDAKLGQLGEVLRRRIAGRDSPDTYLERLEIRPAAAELQALAEELTVGETYFFRNVDQLRAFAEVALPEAMAAWRSLRVLSAGCASGEEPYSLAILARQRAHEFPGEVSIRAVDLNPAALKRAARARYTTWSLRETPPDVQRRWFRPEGSDQLLDPEVRAAVSFEERNIAIPDAELWRPRSYNVVFCRNVMMYFSPERARELVARIAGALVPGGYLFLGHAETLRGISADFHLCHTHGAFYYQKKEGAAQPIPAAEWTAPAPYTSWFDAVQRAAERITALSQRDLAPPPAAPQFSIPDEVAAAAALLRDERFAEALERLGRLPPSAASDPMVLLLRAALLTHSGRLDEAQALCAQLLAVDELNAGSHYLLALCREGSGDRAGAVEHDQMASYLEPGFVMPRLHIGLMARRAGDRATARRELEQALRLLPHEDEARLQLFGGNFSREALIALCRAELAGVGVES